MSEGSCALLTGVDSLKSEWWLGMGAITVHASNVTTETSYRASFSSSYTLQPSGEEIDLDGRTVHTIVHVRF